MPHNKKNERIPIKEAHEEANMMQEKLKVHPGETRYPIPRGRTFEGPALPTAEEYNRAFAEIEDLKHRAETEPLTEKIAFKIIFELRKLKDKLGLKVPLDESLITHGEVKHHWRTGNWYNPEVLMKGLKDAAFELKLLKERAVEFGENAAGLEYVKAEIRRKEADRKK